MADAGVDGLVRAGEIAWSDDMGGNRVKVLPASC